MRDDWPEGPARPAFELLKSFREAIHREHYPSNYERNYGRLA